MPSPGKWGICDRCGLPNECLPYNVERLASTGHPGDKRDLDVCEACWQIWVGSLCAIFDIWKVIAKVLPTYQPELNGQGFPCCPVCKGPIRIDNTCATYPNGHDRKALTEK
jgi:hypothetical protein